VVEVQGARLALLHHRIRIRVRVRLKSNRMTGIAFCLFLFVALQESKQLSQPASQTHTEYRLREAGHEAIRIIDAAVGQALAVDPDEVVAQLHALLCFAGVRVCKCG
jgi:hypothetical protein